LDTYIVKYEGETLEIDFYPRESIEALKGRIRLGNEKLNKAWDDICKMDHNSQQWKDEFQRWHIANIRLSAYCRQLTGMGFSGCLYIDNKGVKYKKCLEPLGCRVCPSSISYWEAELMSLEGESKEENGNAR